MNYDINKITTNEGREFRQPTTGFEDTIRDYVPSFTSFIKEFSSENVYIYSNQLLSNFNQGLFFLQIRFQDLVAFNSNLSNGLEENPDFFLEQFSEACKRVVKELKGIIPRTWQICLSNFDKTIRLRTLGANSVSRLVNVQGIVTNTSRISARATQLCLMCVNCKENRIESTGTKLGGFMLPNNCNNQSEQHCPLDPFLVVADKSLYEDFQILRLQEFPEEVLSGEVPRQVSLLLTGALVSTVKAGQRIRATGVYVLQDTSSEDGLSRAIGAAKGLSTASNKRSGYLRVLGTESSEFLGIHGPHFSGGNQPLNPLESKIPFEILWRSIAPTIFGMDPIKKAITCQLFGGTSRELSGGVRLRGDIHILLLGDPSVAKSQFLKFVEKAAPRAVYTSGKGSSAAGLTAAVVRDRATGEFCLEGGAMVLADNGVVCIDEFDKMRESDRVAIHEAMEQQTISIAKAGITSVLSSRASVLAAANPAFGRYDDYRTTAENVEFQASILSRFDLIFVILDKTDSEKDDLLARHVFDVHSEFQGPSHNVSGTTNRFRRRKVTGESFPQSFGGIEGEGNVVPVDFLKRYIHYARTKVFPELDDEAAEFLESEYVNLRASTANSTSIPITVRQLEAIIRLSESLARMELSEVATKEHALEAVKIFRAATVKAANLGTKKDSGLKSIFGSNREQVKKLSKKVENEIRYKVAVDETVSKRKLIFEVSKECGCNEATVEVVLGNLGSTKDFEVRNKVVKRKR